MNDLFGNKIQEKPTDIRINIYADEVQQIPCPITKEIWIYIGLIIERLDKPLLNDIIKIRYCNNFEVNSSYFSKNNRIIHWSKLKSIDTKNIAERWIKYILNPTQSGEKFYAYVLGINLSKLNVDEFDRTNIFNSVYNRFFRSAILYAIKTCFQDKNVIIENIFHEDGQQKFHKYFPWQPILKIKEKADHIDILCTDITFLPKSHIESEGGNKVSNLIQLCDLFLGLCVSSLHGINDSKQSKYKEELLNLFLPLFERMINNPNNPKSRYAYKGRLMIKFFPKERTELGDVRRMVNQFYTKRTIYFKEQNSGQLKLDFD